MSTTSYDNDVIKYNVDYFLEVSFGSKKRWVRVYSELFDRFYYNDLYCVKCFSCVRYGLRHKYYTFYLQRSNGLVKPNSTVKFMILLW